MEKKIQYVAIIGMKLGNKGSAYEQSDREVESKHGTEHTGKLNELQTGKDAGMDDDLDLYYVLPL